MSKTLCFFYSNNGLLSEEIRDIFQDSEGYLWFLTPEGLNKFDGYDFKIYKPGQQGLNFTTSAFESICEDKQKRLWLGTAEKGILIYDKANHVVIPFEEISNGQKLLDLHIRTLLADMNNNIWIGTEYGLYRFQIENKELTFFNLGNMSAAEPAWCIIESMIEDSKGNIWIGTWNMGLFRFNTVREQFSNFNLFDKSLATNNSNRIKSLYEDRHGAIWVGTWEDGLYEVRLERLTQQRGHRTLGLEVAHLYWLAIEAFADRDVANALLEIDEIGRETEDRHDLRGDRDVEARFPRHSVRGAS